MLESISLGFHAKGSRFSLGEVRGTPMAGNALRKARADVFSLLTRHSIGDWGDVSPEHAERNQRAIEEGDQIFSIYILPGTGETVWIVTEDDRSATLILLPEEN